MKAVLISIQPKWCQLIASGKKTTEVRKTKPNLQTPFKCYIYCTTAIKKINTLWSSRLRGKYYYCDDRSHNLFDTPLNRAVIGEFVCDKIDKHFYDNNFENNSAQYPIANDELSKMCLSYYDFLKYGKGKTINAWHITYLKIYDKPKALNEFYAPCQRGYNDMNNAWCYREKNGRIYECKYNDREKGECCSALHRPPQSWCYVEEMQS